MRYNVDIMVNMFEHKFTKVLDSDEKIEMAMRSKVWRVFGISIIFNLLIIAFVTGIMGVVFWFALKYLPDKYGDIPDGLRILRIILLILIILVILVIILLFVFPYIRGIISCLMQYYALTNKRLIIRRGILSVHYASLSIDAVGTIDIVVKFIDRIFRSGSLFFRSAHGGGGGFCFMCVDDPYGVQKALLKTIAALKEAKSK